MKHVRKPSRVRGRSQSGAAFIVSVIMLVILTLLGIAALRASRLELRLSQNSESRLLATQAAQALQDGIIGQAAANLNIALGTGYISCSIVTGTKAPARTGAVGSACAGVSLTPTLPSGLVTDYTYAEVQRDPDAPEFVTINAARGAGFSGRDYDFARFIVTTGFDNTLTGQGAAEITQGELVPHVKPQGVTYQ